VWVRLWVAKESLTMCLAIPGQVIELVDAEKRLAKVDVAGVRRTVNIGLLDSDGDSAGEGDWVLIHVGFALSKIDEKDAAETLQLLQGMGAALSDEFNMMDASAQVQSTGP
jgi:hydrogenase expression/formation protein HypC